MDRRIFGLENEYGVTCTFRGQRRLSPDEVARYLFRRVVSWGRSSNVFLRNGARLYLDTAKNGKALQKLNEAVAKDPRDTKALMLIATIQNEAKDYAAARSAYEKLLAVNPSFYPALNNLAYLYSEQFREVDKAYDMARKARELLTYKGQSGDDAAQSQARGFP